MKRPLNGAGPSLAQLDRAKVLHRSLIESRGDIDKWVRAIGYKALVRVSDLPDYTRAALFNGTAYIRDNTGWYDQVFAIAHEDTHRLFHAECVAYQDLDLFQIEKDETQADLVGMLVLYPSLEGFETEEEFIRTCPLGEYLARLRVKYHHRKPNPFGIRTNHLMLQERI